MNNLAWLTSCEKWMNLPIYLAHVSIQSCIQTTNITSVQGHISQFCGKQAIDVRPSRMINSKHARKESSRISFLLAQHSINTKENHWKLYHFKYAGESLQTEPFHLQIFFVNQITSQTTPMQGRTIIILASLVVYIATAIMADPLYNHPSQEDISLKQRRSDFSRLLRRLLADKRSLRFKTCHSIQQTSKSRCDQTLAY